MVEARVAHEEHQVTMNLSRNSEGKARLQRRVFV